MKLIRKIFVRSFILLALAAIPSRAQETPKEYQEVLTLLGRSGDFKANVLKVNIPRSDLHVSISGQATPTPFGFGGWIAMTKGDGGMEVLMGDLVLTQEEVRAVAEAGGSVIVSPNCDSDVVLATNARGLASWPGVLTPSECFAALKAGAGGSVSVSPRSRLRSRPPPADRPAAAAATARSR